MDEPWYQASAVSKEEVYKDLINKFPNNEIIINEVINTYLKKHDFGFGSLQGYVMYTKPELIEEIQKIIEKNYSENEE